MAAITEFLGTGRRKTSIARVRIATGSGKINVNGLALRKLFSPRKPSVWSSASPGSDVTDVGKV